MHCACAGSLLALSDTQTDSQDVFCIADGVLRMALTKETYEKAGLEGHVSRFEKKRRWNVTVDLKALSMMAGKKGFERLQWSFTETLLSAPIFDLLWANADEAQWWSLNVQGSEDAPISWAGREHGRDKAGSGENGYTILRMGSREEGLMWEVVGGDDEYS
ncbi:hypothetical protein YB2330_006448 [Saitoella coloradoensis]